MLEVLWGFAAVGAGSSGPGVVVPGRVCVEVALPRPHLVKAARVSLGEAFERMGLW